MFTAFVSKVLISYISKLFFILTKNKVKMRVFQFKQFRYGKGRGKYKIIKNVDERVLRTRGGKKKEENDPKWKEKG